MLTCTVIPPTSTGSPVTGSTWPGIGTSPWIGKSSPTTIVEVSTPGVTASMASGIASGVSLEGATTGVVVAPRLNSTSTPALRFWSRALPRASRSPGPKRTV